MILQFVFAFLITNTLADAFTFQENPAENLLLLFDRVNEPIYIPKGENRVSLAIPADYLPEGVHSPEEANQILNRFGQEGWSSVPIRKIAIPDLTIPLQLDRSATFSLFIPDHGRMHTRLTKLFMGMRTIEDLLSLACYCRDRINSQMFIYSLTEAILNRPDTKNLSLPKLSEIFPDKFLDNSVIQKAREAANVLEPGSRLPIEIPFDYTSNDKDPEHRVAYWREDIGANLHHWHWHLLYPFNGDETIVKKDRRGELFYHSHHQMMARHNTERLCNGLSRAKPFDNWRQPIPEAYFPKLDQVVAGRAWPSRPANIVPSDVVRSSDRLNVTIADMETFRDRLIQAIDTRTVYEKGTVKYLDDFEGINVLGNMIEASVLSSNPEHYGDLHNSLHVTMAFIHDPDHRYLESASIMGDVAVAMRDPIFYRVHAYTDVLFSRFKDSLTPYTVEELTFPGITVADVGVKTVGGNPNTLYTFWSKSDLDLARGLDFSPRGSVLVRVQHLNHEDFDYSLTIINSNPYEVRGTVRIFLAPKFGENGRALSFDEQRKLMVEMDKFTTRLHRGQNFVTRKSTESSLTIPFESTFRDLDKGRPQEVGKSLDAFNFCGCGWPHHLLVPKGTAQGYPMDLFVMLTDYDTDKVNQSWQPTGCSTGTSFCGLIGLKYPDSRPMGYPFDRRGRNAATLSEFLTPNMKAQQVTVRFSDEIKRRG